MTKLIVIMGAVGSGKTTTAKALSEQFEHNNLAHALIDMDYLRWFYPETLKDRFSVK